MALCLCVNHLSSHRHNLRRKKHKRAYGSPAKHHDKVTAALIGGPSHAAQQHAPPRRRIRPRARARADTRALPGARRFLIGVLAIKNLPPSCPDFLKSDDAVWQVGETRASRIAGAAPATTHDTDPRPRPLCRRPDDQAILGGPSLNGVAAHARSDYDAALRAVVSTFTSRLSALFDHRRLAAAGEGFRLLAGASPARNSRKTDAARAWFDSDRRGAKP